MSSNVVVVGSFNVDHVWRCEALPAPGATIAGRYSTGPGGKGFNQAVAARRAGAQTTFVCALGEDAGGAMARGLAAQDGFTLSAEASTEPTGTGGIYVDARGRNTIVIGPGANAALSIGFVQQQQALLAGAKVVLVQLESPVETIEAALAVAREAGVTTVLNAAPADAPSSIGLLKLADVITPNETEFAALLSRHVGERVDPNDVAALDGASLHALCRKLVGSGTVVVTLGAVGVFVSHDEDTLRGDSQPYYRVGAEQVHAIDTTGAGDAFNGALVASIAHSPDAPFARHVRFANQFAGRSTEKEGAAAAMPHFTPDDQPA
ncbi:ribokinase [Stenotrophomonas chelatiphaga]|jgi:ribokinase|uniref:Ribokinase n=1 Tax=Stenotrophomonas chelatiphaga TaxID=517011 RepID=A0A0R0CYM0_9GAMM|nr:MULTISPECIES: ribokinase [Stenotrophomonas]KRG74861.1 ribokinase [Stenotrophomonas chelatiphaga]MCS4232163.1 ribokinase [Stenotrophomonas chelatiphaga]MDR6095735.1 ribokinase [Stenotrophomonas sp. SORGH_AS_0321]ROQ48530.1 ribokinase [Stenotrophomonas maltophilia]